MDIMKENQKRSVGVITMHRVINYGSFLQAYATQQAIEKLNCTCEIIDYVFPNEWHYQNGLHDHRNIKSIITEYTYKLGLIRSHRKRYNIEKAIAKYLNLSIKFDTPEAIHKAPPKYDVYVTGSDQTWNPKHTKGDTTFLLSFVPDNGRKISFSASIAAKDMSQEYSGIFEKYLKKYDALSVRDSNGAEVVHSIINKSALVTLDPTLILNREEWSEFALNEKSEYKNEKYIIFYLITHSFDPRPYIYELLFKLQQESGYKVYSFTKIPKELNIDFDDCSDISVENFISLFEHASFVVTSSFHGTAFAANFGIPLYSVVNDLNGHDDRQASLLSKLGIENCLVSVGTHFSEINPKYDVIEEQNKLNKLRSCALSYLKSSL